MISCRVRLLTVDETWLYHYDPETKQHSVVWQHISSPHLKKFWVQKSAGKTINAEYYSFVLVQLKDILKEKCRGKITKGVLFLHDNAPADRALATQKKLAYLGFHCLDQPPYSLDLGPVGLPPVPWTEKRIESSPFFVRHRGHCWCEDLVGRTTFWIFLEWLAKVRTTG